MNSPLYLHITFLEHRKSFESIFRTASELGFDGVELRQKPIGWEGSLDDYLDVLTKAFEQHPLSALSFGYPCVDLMVSDPAARERNLDTAEDFYRKAADRFPVKVVNAMTGSLSNPDASLPYTNYWHHGSAVATEAQWEQATEGFQRLAGMARECGFKFAFETHGVYLHDTIAATKKLCERIDAPDAVGILWDHANLEIFPETPTMAEAIKEMGGLLFQVHLKNLLLPPKLAIQTCALGTGILNIREQLQLLDHAGYTGPIAIESPRLGDREQFLKEDLAYYRSVIEEISIK